MTTKPKLLLCWSGGKDSSFTLHTLRKENRFEIVALLTTLTEDYDRVSMHGFRRELLEAQARAAGFPLEIVRIPGDCSNETYEQRMARTLETWKSRGVNDVAFGDIFLQDLRDYREAKLAEAGMKAQFPIWKRNTKEMAREFIGLGFRAILTCVDSRQLDGTFSGRTFDEELLAELPEGVDPCGENGEFHSFVFAGPIFNAPIPCRLGRRVIRENRFHFCDILPEEECPLNDDR